MPLYSSPILGVLASTLLALSAAAQEPGIHWQRDIESAKVQARESGRLVLVHVVADGCMPCQALESNVFIQPGVAQAIEQRFVPVKLNANEFPAIAQGFGITRVPTDVILTPDGQILSKAISPATPSAYVADTTNVATKYASQLGQNYQVATAAPPQPPALNSAYTSLPIGAAPTPLAAAVPGSNAPVTAPAVGSALAAAPLQATVPATVANAYATPATQPINSSAQPPVTPIPSNPAANPYAAYAPPTQPAVGAAAAPQTGYEPTVPSAPTYSMPQDVSVPPSSAGRPVSEEAKAPTATQQVAAPDPSKLPPGAPPLGFDGYCPVSMRTAWKWTPGDPRFGAIHRGRTYWFAGADEQKQFLSNPDYYSPALEGMDPVLAIDHRQSVPGLREHSLDYDGQFFLFSSEATLQQFTSNPDRYATSVRQAMGLQPTQQAR